MSYRDKRFIAKCIPVKAWRKLDLSLRQAWFYLWMTCDPAGVCDVDEDIFTLNEGGQFPWQKLEKHMSEWLEFDPSSDRILIKDFIRVNQGTLKPDYNPHKPVFRSIEKNNLKLNPSLNEASFKLVVEVEVEVKKEEGYGEKPKKEIYPIFPDDEKAQTTWEAKELIRKDYISRGGKWDEKTINHASTLIQRIKNVTEGKHQVLSPEAVFMVYEQIANSDNWWVKNHFSMKTLDEKFTEIFTAIHSSKTSVKEPDYAKSKYASKLS